MSDVMRPEPRAMGNLFGREDAIRAGRCLSCSATFAPEQIAAWPEMTQKEFATCGLCRECQGAVFGCTCDNPCCEADIGVGVINCGSQHCSVHGADAGRPEWVGSGPYAGGVRRVFGGGAS